jgi:phospholipid/cholesterol/gamma-HCH transport system ATP-binding protein
VTSIVVTHDIHSAFMVAERIVFLHGGVIHYDGTPQDAEGADNPIFRNFLEGKELDHE